MDDNNPDAREAGLKIIQNLNLQQFPLRDAINNLTNNDANIRNQAAQELGTVRIKDRSRCWSGLCRIGGGDRLLPAL